MTSLRPARDSASGSTEGKSSSSSGRSGRGASGTAGAIPAAHLLAPNSAASSDFSFREEVSAVEADFDAKFCSVMEDPFSAHRNRPEFAGGRGNFKIISTFIDKPGLYRYQNSQMRLIIKRCKQPGFVICNLLNGTTYNKMSKNQAASTVNWRKILKKYLADSTAAAVSRGGVDPGTVALPLLRARFPEIPR